MIEFLGNKYKKNESIIEEIKYNTNPNPNPVFNPFPKTARSIIEFLGNKYKKNESIIGEIKYNDAGSDKDFEINKNELLGKLKVLKRLRLGLGCGLELRVKVTVRRMTPVVIKISKEI
jgi:hypothetical protein